MSKNLKELLNERILVLDGAMGSLIQQKGPEEADYRGSKLKEHEVKLKGNHELLNINCPDLIFDVHSSYLKAGADIITTNSFNANALSQKDYKTQDLCYMMNYEAAKIAKKAAVEHSSVDKQRFVAGCVGPTSKSLSMSQFSSSEKDEKFTYDILVSTYREQISGLLDGGADILLIETIFDTLNAKAAIYASENVFKEKKKRIPVMISATIAGEAGRLLSGQTIPAFYHSIQHANPLVVGLNCSFGASKLQPFVQQLVDEASCFVSFHPNAGIPEHDGSYSQSPKQMAKDIEKVLKKTGVNIFGGCCGTTPEHVEAYSELSLKYKPVKRSNKKNYTVLAGLEHIKIDNSNGDMVYIGEKTNVAGSKKFAKLIEQKDYQTALSIAQKQLDDGAQLLDICMDKADINSKDAIKDFLIDFNAHPQLAKLPVMIDSSDFETVREAMKYIQGKPIINSISLKNGEKDFLNKAEEIKKFGGAVVVMLFDEKGQADTTDRRKEIITRSYRLLTEEAGFSEENIIFDPNVMALAADVNNSVNQAVSFLDACKYIKSNFPKCNITGGVSNISFAFKGAGVARKAINHVFLQAAKDAGVRLPIVNPLDVKTNNLPDNVIELANSLVFNNDEKVVDKLLELNNSNITANDSGSKTSWRDQNLKSRLKHSLINGIDDYLKVDIEEATKKYDDPYDVIESLLMPAMDQVSSKYDKGDLFLPQVIRSATVFQKAVDCLHPHINSQSNSGKNKTKGKVVIATVEGDVHDIGKNIASIVFKCNGFEVIDLGVMVPAEKIVKTAIDNNAGFVGLSGLITPSLNEMENVAKLMQEKELNIPLLVGGATTSEKHTKKHIAKNYNGKVIHVKDASKIGSVIQSV